MNASLGVIELANRIENDIKSRSFSEGDPYDTTAETARRFGVSTSSANRALQLLTKKGLIVRKQRSGASIGCLTAPTDGTLALDSIYIVLSARAAQTEGILSFDFLQGIQEELPGITLQQRFFPQTDHLDFINQLIAETLKEAKRPGFVLIRSSAEVQRALSLSGLPTVISGGIYPSITGVCSIDRDHTAIGKSLAESAIHADCQKHVILMRSDFGPGDRTYVRSLLDRLGEAGVALSDIAMELLPPDEKVIRAIISDHLKAGKGQKLSFLCKNSYLAEQVMREMGSRDPHKVFMADCYVTEGADTSAPFPTPTWGQGRIGTEIARLLVQQNEKPMTDRNVTELVIPIEPIPLI